MRRSRTRRRGRLGAGGRQPRPAATRDPRNRWSCLFVCARSHCWPSPAAARVCSVIIPVRTRVFTVPSGSPKRSASSDCVRPRKYACSISCRCSGGSASSARATARCCSLSAARASGLSTGGGSGVASTVRSAHAVRAQPIDRAVPGDRAPARPPAARARRCRCRRASRPARTLPAGLLRPRCGRAGCAESARTAAGCDDRTARRPRRVVARDDAIEQRDVGARSSDLLHCDRSPHQYAASRRSASAILSAFGQVGLSRARARTARACRDR